MKQLLNSVLPTPEKRVLLDPEEANHALNVLRIQPGESVHVIDGTGHKILALLEREADRTVWLKWIGAGEVPTESGARITDITLPIDLELGVLKGDAMEWAIEKAVELGARSLTPLLTSHCVVQMRPNKGPEAFQTRWQKIADQALKQCGRTTRMKVSPPLHFQNYWAQKAKLPEGETRLWAHDEGKDSAVYLAEWLQVQNPLPHALKVLIGPEGGWSSSESAALTQSTQAVSLGPWILRAETAVLFALSCSAASFRLQELDKYAKKQES